MVSRRVIAISIRYLYPTASDARRVGLLGDACADGGPLMFLSRLQRVSCVVVRVRKRNRIHILTSR